MRRVMQGSELSYSQGRRSIYRAEVEALIRWGCRAFSLAGCILWVFDLNWPAFHILIAVLYFVYWLFDSRGSTLSISLNVVLLFIFYVPVVSLMVSGDFYYNVILYFSFLIFDLLVYFSSKNKPENPIFEFGNVNPSLADFFICLFLLFMTIINPFFIGGVSFFGLFGFLIPFGLSLIFYERNLRGSNKFRVYILISLYFVSILFYILFHWGGFGRIVVAVYFMIPVLLAYNYGFLYVRTWQALLLAFPVTYVAQLSRHSNVDFSTLHIGSGAHHMVLTMELFENLARFNAPRWGEFWGQWGLFFLNWFPREPWPTKPIGVGTTFVDDWIGRAGYGAGYNVSVGYIGETLYFLGPYFLIGVLIYFLTIVLTRKGLERFARGYISILVVFDTSLISYFWGGGASFGSRAWFIILPMIAAVTALSFFNRKKL